MQDRVIFEYAIIKLVPQVERGEYLNLGVILFSKRLDFLDIRYTIDEKRIKAFSDHVDIETLTEYLDNWRLICLGGEEAGKIGELDTASRFRWLVSSRSTILQTTATHPGLCRYPEKKLDKLFKQYVL